MNDFERIVALLLEKEGYWVRRNFFVEMTPVEKRRAGNKSMPRPEIDLIALKPGAHLLVGECKWYGDSNGVSSDELLHGGKRKSLYWLFNNQRKTSVVLRCMRSQLMQKGLLEPGIPFKRALFAGKFRNANHQARARKHFSEKRWLLWGQEDITQRLNALADAKYEDEAIVYATKLLRRSHACQNTKYSTHR